MLSEIRRFYRTAATDAPTDPTVSLGAWLDQHRFHPALLDDHLLPMAAAIWSCRTSAVRDHPARAFIRFCDNHGLLRLADRPAWRTVTGGSRVYVDRLARAIEQQPGCRILASRQVLSARRDAASVTLRDSDGETARFDELVLATHAGQGLGLLEDASADERRWLGACRTSRNIAVLHQDAALMPRRRAAWASWNHIGTRGGDGSPCVTYWMNRLQGLRTEQQLFVTLNPPRAPAAGSLLASNRFNHPLFDAGSHQAQARLWAAQGSRRTWFAGAWLGDGFHEDGVQSGLAVAEALGARRRPWTVASPSGRMPGGRCDRGAPGRRMNDACFYDVLVTHDRPRPVRHSLRTRLFSLLLDLDGLARTDARLRLFSVNRRNIVSFHEADHGAGAARGLKQWVEAVLGEAGFGRDPRRILLLCMPRVLGHGFNPLSVYFCYDTNGTLDAILYQVNNMHGERHCYLVAITEPAPVLRHAAEKCFHVSPFMPMDMTYRFRVRPPAETLLVAIEGVAAQGRLIGAVMTGQRQDFTDARLLRALCRLPPQGLRVLGGIYWEALKLWRKGVRPRRHPGAPAHSVTIGG